MKAVLVLLVLVLALVQARKPRHEPKVIANARDQYFQPTHKRGIYYIKNGGKTTDCTFKGYAPNGPATSVGDIKAPKATLDAKKSLMGVMAGPTKKLGKVTSVVMHAIKFSSKIMTAFPALAPALGVFSALTGFVGGEPSPQDILDKVNVAIKTLTDEMNTKLREMENYVDASIAEAEKSLITAEYQTSFRLWAACIKERTEAEGTRCQRDAATHIVAKKPKFIKNAHLLQNNVITMKQVRTWEAYMLAFRDYANLVVMQLTTLTQYYCLERKNLDESPHNCQRYSGELITEATSFIKYAQGSIAAIKKGHWGTRQMGPCPGTQSCSCSDIVEGKFWLIPGAHTADSCKCKCVILDASKKKYCEVRFTIRVDGKGKNAKYPAHNYPHIAGITNFGEAHQYYGKSLLNSISKDYQVKNHAVMEKYWNQEVLDFVPEWTKAIQLAKDLKAENPLKPNDATPVLDEGFSPEYRTRLANAGYRFMEIEKSDGTYEIVPMGADTMEDQEENDDEVQEDVPEESHVDEFYSYSNI